MASTRNRIVTGVAVLAVAGGGAAAGYVARGDGNAAAPVAATTTDTGSSAQPAASNSTLSVNEIYRKARSGVVEVIATESSSDSPFPGGGSGSSQAQGSGFVYDSDGHIVTNQHVVDGATSVTIRFADGRKMSAQVVGTDLSTDLAVLKVSNLPSNVTPLGLGSSDDLKVGDGVVAIGSPFGLEETVTSGIVSALDREIQSPNNYAIEGAIQTDAAINHGNSGGPLLDMHGLVIGVTSQIESDSGGNDGVGFAIPSSTVKSIATRLIASGKVEHAFLGVTPADATSTAGARITSVASGSPASRGGIQEGDVVTEVDGRSVADAAALRSAIDSHAPGDKVKVTVDRGGTTHTLTVTLGTRPSA
jgi:putative serine protease PepD